MKKKTKTKTATPESIAKAVEQVTEAFANAGVKIYGIVEIPGAGYKSLHANLDAPFVAFASYKLQKQTDLLLSRDKQRNVDVTN